MDGIFQKLLISSLDENVLLMPEVIGQRLLFRVTHRKNSLQKSISEHAAYKSDATV